MDDSKVIRMTLQKVLQKLGLRPQHLREASDGAEAIETFRTFSPKIVFLDILMPGIDGEETARALLEIDPETKIIFLTGVAREDDRVRRMISEGVFDFIEKPVRIDEVRRVLEVVEREEIGFGRIK